MTENANGIITGRFLDEERAAFSAYLKIAALSLEKDVTPALNTDAAYAQNNAEEILIILKRLFWFLDGGQSIEGVSLNKLMNQLPVDQKAFEELKSLTSTAEAPRIDINAKLVECALRDAVPEAKHLNVESLKLVAGGRSKLTALFQQSGCDALPRKLVLRLDWASSVTGTSVMTEFELLKRVHAAGVLAPEPFALIDADNPIGAPFIIVSQIAGATCGDIFQPPDSEKIALQLAQQFAKIHAIPLVDLDGLPTIVEREYGREKLKVSFDEFCAIYDQLGVENPLIVELIALIEQSLPKIEGPKTLVHSDLGFHNFLIDGETLTAILDWELAHLGNPANDLGYIRGDIEKMTPWPKFMAAYRDAGGAELSEIELDFYFLWSLFRLYCLLLRARAGIIGGQVQDVAVARVCVDAVPRLLETIATGVRRMNAK